MRRELWRRLHACADRLDADGEHDRERTRAGEQVVSHRRQAEHVRGPERVAVRRPVHEPLVEREAFTPDLSLRVELAQTFEDLLSAFRQDVTTTRYETWDDLLDWAMQTGISASVTASVDFCCAIRSAWCSAW